MKLTFKDVLVIYMVKFIQWLGYDFYIRGFIDSPEFNGNDVALFFKEDSYCSLRVIALAHGFPTYREYITDRGFKFVGKR